MLDACLAMVVSRNDMSLSTWSLHSSGEKQIIQKSKSDVMLMVNKKNKADKGIESSECCYSR